MPSAIEIVSLNVVYSPQNGEPISALCDILLTIEVGQLVGLLGPDGAGKSTLLSVIAGQLEPTTGYVRVKGFDVVAQRERARQQVALYRGMAHPGIVPPPILMLDEPDKPTGWRAQAKAREQGQTLLLATSRPSLAAALCERVLVIDMGRLVADVPAAILQHALKPEHYAIRVRGCLPQDWSDWFGGLRVATEGTDTILDGYLPDQAALHGVLDAIRGLNLTLLSVQYLEPEIRELIDRLGRRQ
jgi:ABC-type multidrug transport system ATPase subunit